MNDLPRRIVLLNPNSTSMMTESILRSATHALRKTCFLADAWTNHGAPASIQGPEDGDLATPPLLVRLLASADLQRISHRSLFLQRLVRQATAEDAAAIVIACADDTALAEARSIAAASSSSLLPPVVLGIGQAGFHAAALQGNSFGCVTSVAEAIPVLERNIHALGLARYLTSIRSSAKVLDIASGDTSAVAAVSDAVAALREEGASSVVLGCSAMSPLAGRLTHEHQVPVICGVTAACHLAAALIRTVDAGGALALSSLSPQDTQVVQMQPPDLTGTT